MDFSICHHMLQPTNAFITSIIIAEKLHVFEKGQGQSANVLGISLPELYRSMSAV